MVNNDVFAVIADKTRRGILAALKDGERPVGELVAELGVAQPTVSKHLKILRDAGMVSMEARGQRRLYAVRAEPLAEVTDWVQQVAGGAARGPEPAEGLPAPVGTAGAPAGGDASVDPAAATESGAPVPAEPAAAAGPGAEESPTAAAEPTPRAPGAVDAGPGLPVAVPAARPARAAAGGRAGGLFSGLAGLRRRTRRPRR